MNEFNDTPFVDLSSRWTRSVESQTIHELEVLADDGADSIDEVWFSLELAAHLSVHSTPDRYSDQWGGVVRDIMHRPYYLEGTAEEQRRIRAALMGDPCWVYTTVHKSDGLWEQAVPTRRAPLNKMSRFVLSGALGDAILDDDPGLLRQAESFTEGRLNAAILIGGAATYMYQRLTYREAEQGVYHALDASGLLEWTTHTGGDIHGDFRTSRSARPVKAITDTVNTGFEHHFMPAIHEASVGAYHSVEPGIVSGLLYYLVAHQGVERRALHDRLIQKLERSNIKTGGAFADYGDSDGEHAALAMAHRLRIAQQDGVKNDELLYQSVVVPDPAAALRFTVQSQKDGVRCAVHEGTHVASEMVIPEAEIEQYIIAVITGGGGRTAPGAMLRSIDALVNEP